MDQSAFRAMLASGSGGGSPRSSATTSAVLGAGSRKRHHETSAAATSSSLGQFKPRAKATSGSSKGKEREEPSSSKDKDKEDGVPSYRRFGYTDRASMRRAGLAEDGTTLLPGSQREEEQEERRPRGLDTAQLAASKRALLLGEDYVAEEEQAHQQERETSRPPKTEEEIERELEEAAQSLKQQQEADKTSKPYAKNQYEAENPPPPKKQKRSRADMLRDLQAKIASASGGSIAPGATVDVSEPVTEKTSKKSTNGVASLPSAMKGFKAIEKAPEKKKKKKKLPKDDPNGVTAIHLEELSTSGPRDPFKAVDTSAAKNSVLKTEETAVDDGDDDFDIFAGAGEYEDGFGDEPDEKAGAEEGELDSVKESMEREKPKYFDDQDELIPKFQAYRSPTPPSRDDSRPDREQASTSASRRPSDGEEAIPAKPQRLEGFSTSSYTARDLLDYDDAQAREEKRKLKKLKGKEKKEAMEAEEQYKASKSAEQKEKDKLNREVQEYEKYERKKQAKGTSGA